MKIHKLNLENYYRNAVDSAIAVKAGLTPAIFAARPTYNDVLLGFNDGETPTLLLPKWAQFTIDLSKNKPSWAPASLMGTLTVTITPSVVGVSAEEDDVTLGNVNVYGVSVASTGKQYKVTEGFYSIGLNVMVVNENNVPVIAYSDGRPMKVIMQKVADTGPDTNVDVAAGGGTFTQEQADWNQSDDTKVDYIKNKPTIPAAQVNADWNAESGVAQILNKPTIPAAPVNADWNAESGLAQILNKPTIPTVNNATLTLTQGTTTLGTFTANASSDVTVDIPAGGGGGASIIEKTWSELKAMRDGGTLVPGQQYKITDYETKISQSGFSVQHYAKSFDIVVTAETASKLSEDARTAYRVGTSDNDQWYFDLCKVRYCIDNDTNRFTWANTSQGKGVIYWMKDPWNNEAWFDFTNITANYAAGIYSGGVILAVDTSRTGGAVGHNCQLGPYIYLNKLMLPNCCIVGYNIHVGASCNNVYATNQSIDSVMVIGPACEYIVAQNTRYGVVIGDRCEYVYFGDGSSRKNNYANIEIGHRVCYVNLNCTSENLSSGFYQNVKVCSGVSGTSSSSKLTISDSNVNQSYQTTFFKETDGTLKKQEGTTITTVA